MDLIALSRAFNKLSVTSRLQDTAYFMRSDEAARIQLVRSVFERLDPGVYLAGAGPYTQGVYSLMSDEVVIGRLATVLESPIGQAVDVFVNDAATLTPREVSRLHCSIYRHDGVSEHDYWLIDRGSTCGTFLNGEKLEVPKTYEEPETRRVSRALVHGDVISLGASLVNTFLFVDLRG
jgi:pSer/pThr/pTyr-binding forkhead associated (FHA) protein